MFRAFRVADVRPETDDCVSVALEAPAGFSYLPGQYLTFRAILDGVEVRRSYSICTAPTDPELRVAVKQVPGGVFSSYVATTLRPGDRVDVLGPEGRFTPAPGPKPRRHVLGIAAGSGITPVLGIVRHTLVTESTARVTLVYGNRTAGSIIFREQLADLKDRYLDRLRVIHVLSREAGLPLHTGRIDAEKIRRLMSSVLDAEDVDEVFVCGPQQMSVAVRGALLDAGVDAHRIHVELFGTPTPAPPPPVDLTAGSVRAQVMLHGRVSQLEIAAGETVLAAGRRVGMELPWSCTAGVCATCRAKVEGPVVMAANHALEPWELAAGYRLTCQSRPCGQPLVVDYDA